MIDTSRKPIFVFIGTLKHHVDCIAPCLGKLLEKEDLGFKVMYCDQSQIEDVAKELKSYDKKEYQVIAFDVGFIDSPTRYQTFNHGIKPASLILDHEVEIGEVGIVINIKGVYSGKLKNQQKKFLANKYDIKIHKRVDKVINYTYVALKKLIKLYDCGKEE